MKVKEKILFSIAIIILMLMLVLIITDVTLINQTRESLRVDIIPQNPQANNGDQITLLVEVEKQFGCQLSCSFTLADEQEILQNTSFSKSTSFSLDLAEKERSGQFLYRAQATCQQESSTFCPARSVQKRTIITMDNKLSEEQERQKGQAEEKIMQFFEQSSNITATLEVLQTSQEVILLLGKEEERVLEWWKNERFEDVITELSLLNLNTLQEEAQIQLEQENQQRTINNALYTNASSALIVLSFDYESNATGILEQTLKQRHNLSSPNAFLEAIAQGQAEISAINASLPENVSLQETCEQTNLHNNQSVCTPKNLSESRAILQNLTFLPLLSPFSEEKILPPSQSLCCGLTCNACCIDCAPKTILFIHGHSFNEENTPAFSMQDFALIQNKLEKDQGFLSGGELVPGGQNWSMHNTTTTFRASYYYLTAYDFGGHTVVLQRSERIENYALRLHELVQDAQSRGGSEVTLVGHSMGGLVIREYVRIFGRDAVDDIIFINSPHQGIDETRYQACTTFGADKECEDMREDSIFLQRLNNQPIHDMHNIYSVGCAMGNTTGDGIVTQENAFLPGAENYVIQGNCTTLLNTDLHTETLNIRKYPEVFTLLVSILNS